MLLEFLVVNLRTVDGNRNSALSVLEKKVICSETIKHLSMKEKKAYIKKARKEIFSDDGSHPHEQKVYKKVIIKFNLMRVRMKLSFIAL